MKWKQSLHRIFHKGIRFLTWTLLFSIAYTQSPLFTSNQNQYFLHGLASAGLGTLRLDWLANTSDPTPLFSLLVKLTYLAFNQPWVFYLYYALLLGVYFLTLMGIASLLIELRAAHQRWLLLAALLILIHSAGWRFMLSQLFGSNWAYLLEDGLADQRMLGPVFQPSTFGVFLLVAVWFFLKEKYFGAALAMAVACAFHPTYLMSALFLACAMLWVHWVTARSPLKTLAFAGLALVGVLPVVLYVSTSFGAGSTATAGQAREILVNYRIPHHAQAALWFDITAMIKVGIVTSSIFFLRPPLAEALKRIKNNDNPDPGWSTAQKLGLLMLASGSLAAGLSIIQALSGDAWLALLFPWRISTLLVPLSVLVLMVNVIRRLFPDSNPPASTRRKFVYLSATFILFMAVLVGMVRLKLDFDRKAAEPERQVQAYIREHHQTGDVYLTPVKMQDFRLFATAPAYIDFKSIPYKDSDVLEWYRRLQLADRYFNQQDCGIIDQLSAQEGITHVVQPVELTACPGFTEIYADSAYSLYRLTGQ